MDQSLSQQTELELARRNTTWLATLPFTFLVSAASITLSLAWWYGASISFAFAYQAVWSGQYWRFITSTFVHGNTIHLASSLILAWILGVPLERRYGLWRMVLLYSILAIGSNATQFLSGSPGLGMSGVLFGYFGLILAAGDAANGPRVKHRGLITFTMLILFVVSLIQFAGGTMRIGIFSHCAGLVLGLAMGYALRAERPTKRLVLVGVFSLALAPMTLYMPWNCHWWWHRTEVFRKRQDRAQAVGAAKRTIELAENDRDVVPLLIFIGEEAIGREAYEEAIPWFTRAMLVTELPASVRIKLAAAYYQTYRDDDARWLLLRVNPDDLTPQQRKTDFFTWYLNWARTSATQPASAPAADSPPTNNDLENK